MDEKIRICSFPPIIDDKSKVLVLGTAPGPESLRQQRYYAFGPNHFWRVMFGVFGLDVPEVYEEKIAFLHAKYIAVWDVLESCERKGSADSDIRRPVPNRIAELLAEHPGIGHVCLNGNGATRLYKRFIVPGLTRAVPSATFPSTSPAYATMPYDLKLEGWRKILEFLT